MVIRNAESDLWCSIIPGLDVSVECLFLETTGSKVNELDSWFIVLFQEDVFWFEVAVDDTMLFEELQTDEYLDGESSDQFLTESIVVVANDEFVQIITEQLEYYADMFTEYYEILDANHIRLSVIVSFLYVRKNLDLDKSLLGELRIAFDHFERNLLLIFMVKHF